MTRRETPPTHRTGGEFASHPIMNFPAVAFFPTSTNMRIVAELAAFLIYCALWGAFAIGLIALLTAMGSNGEMSGVAWATMTIFVWLIVGIPELVGRSLLTLHKAEALIGLYVVAPAVLITVGFWRAERSARRRG